MCSVHWTSKVASLVGLWEYAPLEKLKNIQFDAFYSAILRGGQNSQSIIVCFVYTFAWIYITAFK